MACIMSCWSWRALSSLLRLPEFAGSDYSMCDNFGVLFS